MLEAVLNHLHNWFPVKGAARCGEFEIVSGELCVDFLKPGQYYRIVGSVFNDGLHSYPCDDVDCLTDETFTGEVWPLAVPKAVISLSREIKEYREKNPDSDKVSESFADYSYTRAQTTRGGTSTTGGWIAVFGPRLNAWRKPYE
jgi:hypothetical protein